MNKVLYHGSPTKITDGVILPKQGYINGNKKDTVIAVFATPSLSHARLYAAMGFISHGRLNPRTEKKLYVSSVLPNISGKGYIYVLDHTDEFLSDGPDFYCKNPQVIKRVIEFDVMDEIKKGNIEIYVLQSDKDFSTLSPEEKDSVWRNGTFKRYIPDGAQIDNSVLMTALSKNAERK